MQRALPLLRGQITLSTALLDDDNVLQELSYPERRLEFYVYLYQNRTVMESIVSYHLNLNRKQKCRVAEVKEWIAGSFNVCIPVDINGQDHNTPKRVLIRFPLPYKVGETQHPGNADENLRADAATFIWIRQNCPTIPMGFTAIEHVPLFSRLKWYLHRVVSAIFGYPRQPPYLSRHCSFNLTTGYLIMDHVGSTDAVMLSETWNQLRHDPKRSTNLFRGLSKMLLSMAESPFDRIASLTIDNQGMIQHTNRPLTLRLHHLENKSVPTNIDRDLTYSTTDSYVMDLLSCHDSRLRYAPNSVQDKADGAAQLANLTIMRALLPHFSDRKYRRGPFIMTLTDLHQSNLFVDADWNIKCLVDLEWTCSLPVEMLHPPYWLTSRGVDQLYKGEHLNAFCEIHAEFMDVFEEEEQAHSRAGHNPGPREYHAQRLGDWEFLPKFAKLDNAAIVEFERTISPYWAPDVHEFLDGKIKDTEIYEGRLRQAFAAAPEEPPP